MSEGEASDDRIAVPPLSRSPFVAQLGCQLDHLEHGRAQLSLQVQEGVHTNLFGVAHGGVLMTLLDVVMAYAARSLGEVQPNGEPVGVVTVDLHTQFIKPGEGLLRAVGEVLRREDRLVFCGGRVLNERDQVCAEASGTFKFMKALPVTATTVKPYLGQVD
ncbi:MAG: PaaI family thioesterase [Burkholderiales bacterium]|nr:PaaI family thioesterase [Burkholderiales bacterium]